MSIKVHKRKDGTWSECKATKKPCPLGGTEVHTHFGSVEEVESANEVILKGKFGTLPTINGTYDKEAIDELVNFINENDGQLGKNELIKLVKEKYDLSKTGSVYSNDSFAIRFSGSKSNSSSFSNTVLSLKKLEGHDDKPVIVCLVTPEKNHMILANSTMLSKISHSSERLTEDKIVGSFNGGDIIRNFDGIENNPENFEELYSIHEDTGFHGNLSRLVNATSSIKGTGVRFEPNEGQLVNIQNSAQRAQDFLNSESYQELSKDLDGRVQAMKSEIIAASKKSDNVNTRGREIEYIITEQKALTRVEDLDTANDLGDYSRKFEDYNVKVDIKSKMLYKNSNPKGSNIDKFLEFSSEKDSVYLSYVVGIDANDNIHTKIISPYDTEFLDNTGTNPHWSGRNSRGTTQYNGSVISEMVQNKNKVNNIDNEKAITWLNGLISMP